MVAGRRSIERLVEVGRHHHPVIRGDPEQRQESHPDRDAQVNRSDLEQPRRLTPKTCKFRNQGWP